MCRLRQTLNSELSMRQRSFFESTGPERGGVGFVTTLRQVIMFQGSTRMTSNYGIIEDVCRAIGKGSLADAKEVIKSNYPFKPMIKGGRRYGEYQKTRVFLRDGFIDRYSGEKMVFPPVLRLMSLLMPDEFPFHPNWKMSECHLAYWQLLPTVDHIIPTSRGGQDAESNLVCTSQLRNSAKSNWLLEELGWQLHEPGSLKDWDGMAHWFRVYASNNQKVLADKYISSWHIALLKAIET